jgi:hypothetical protein
LFSSVMIVADPALYHGRKLRTISTSLRTGQSHLTEDDKIGFKKTEHSSWIESQS